MTREPPCAKPVIIDLSSDNGDMDNHDDDDDALIERQRQGTNGRYAMGRRAQIETNLILKKMVVLENFRYILADEMEEHEWVWGVQKEKDKAALKASRRWPLLTD
ncbi:hypothetical protein MPER_08892 [Moniliophthora perniciosa FA553]|nr:hypothetical protein MPER_08892 [Moniliophthora perniciosa FA553]